MLIKLFFLWCKGMLALICLIIFIFIVMAIFYDTPEFSESSDSSTTAHDEENNDRSTMTELEKIKNDYDGYKAYDDCKDNFENNPGEAINHPSRVKVISQPSIPVSYFTHNKNGTYSTKTYITVVDKLTEIKYNVYCWNTIFFDKQLDKVDTTKSKISFIGVEESQDL